MELVDAAHALLRGLYRSMTPGARVTAALLLVAIVVSLAYLTRMQRGSADVELMGGRTFPVSQLTAMEMAFAKAGLSDYQLAGDRIRVPRGQQAAYMAALAEGDAVPPDFGKYLEKVAAAANPFYSRLQMEAMIKAATQNELQSVIRRMRNGSVELASVLYEVQEKRGLTPEKIVTASVSVKLAGSQCIDKDMVQSLRHLVSSGIGCKPENVTVIDLNGGGPYPAGNDERSVATSADDPYGSRKQKYESWYKDKIREHLAYIRGVVVSANVELSPELQNTEFEGKSVVYHRGAPAGPQQAEPAAAKTLQQAPQPQRVTIAVGVPRAYYEEIWCRRNSFTTGGASARPSPRDLAAIETKVHQDVAKSVVALLPPSGAMIDSTPRVHVTTIEPVEPLAVPAPETEDRMAWLGQHWSVLATMGLTVLGLAVLGSMFRTAPAPAFQNSNTYSSPDMDEPPLSEPLHQVVHGATISRDVTDSTLRNELADVVRDDPNAAVSVLRTWIGNVS